MTDPTAGASTDPEAPSESVTDAPAPSTTPVPSTTTEVGTNSPEAVAQRVVTTIDPTVEQGNRVTLIDPITRTNPIEPIVTRVEDHFSNAGHIVDDLRALASELESLLNSLKAGL